VPRPGAANEAKARKMIHYPPWKLALYGLILVLGIVFAIPSMFNRDTVQSWPAFMPKTQMTLGLDLRGGSHLLLEVDTAAVVRDREESLVDSIRTALNGAGIRYTGLGIADQAVSVTISDPARQDEAARLIRDLGTIVGQGIMSAGTRDIAVDTQSGGVIRVTLTDAAIAERRKSAVDQSLEIVRRRIDETGVAEPTIVRQGSDRILIQLPGVQDPARIKNLLGKTAKLAFRLVDTQWVPGTPAPSGSEILDGEDRSGGNQPAKWAVKKRVIVSGDMLVDAQPSFDQRNGEPIVNFKFDSNGARRFADVTKENVGRPFAIVLDNKVISAPVIREPILGGSGQISGSFTVQGANDLAVLLRAGALPAPLTVLEERTVGPDLGADSIHAAIVTGLMGLALVAGFMVLAYGGYGMIANVALIFNTALILAVLGVMGATLTLPGIAGLVLNMGMAVDANVLINERIREETRNGKGAFAALDAGFDRAYATIIDSYVTHLIAVALLFLFGSGPVRGFAITLGIGVITTLFTAVSVVRVIMVLYVRRARPKQLAI
jgi:protein-export membrane protein SecD